MYLLVILAVGLLDKPAACATQELPKKLAEPA
jgi:hypothetical protein